MAHIPVNHHLQPLYRALAFLCGLYVFLFGVFAVVGANGHGMFAQRGLPQVLGLRANQAFAILSIVAGLVIVGGALIGRNADHWVNLVGGLVFLVSGFTMMTLLRTNLNFLGFTMTTCIVSFGIGTVLFTAGLYGKTGTSADVRREEAFRHGRGLRDYGPNGGASA
jgi:hypothetical protein